MTAPITTLDMHLSWKATKTLSRGSAERTEPAVRSPRYRRRLRGAGWLVAAIGYPLSVFPWNRRNCSQETKAIAMKSSQPVTAAKPKLAFPYPAS